MFALIVDADSFPAGARDLICRSADRQQLPAIFVANKKPALPASVQVTFVKVDENPDTADHWIAANATPADLVFTRDIPLAARLVEAGITVLNDRGTVYTSENVRSRLSQRDFMAELRATGQAASGGKTYGRRELQQFANALDRELTQRLKAIVIHPKLKENGHP